MQMILTCVFTDVDITEEFSNILKWAADNQIIINLNKN